MSLVIAGLCDKDVTVVDFILLEWMELGVEGQKHSSGGWEPMWGEIGVFNGTLQQGDCGYGMCCDQCAKIASDYLNKISTQFLETLVHRDRQGCLRGACSLDSKSCGWCTRFTSYNVDEGVCDTCGCSCDLHKIVATSEEAAQIGYPNLPLNLIHFTASE